jgi:SNF2 family DNA or RNA helicase
MRFSQITAGFYKDTEGVEHAFKTNPKQDWLVSWVKEHRKKVVVFCRFIHEIKALEAALTQAGIGHTAIHGAVKDRMACVDLFSTDDKCFVFIGQLDVAGQGLTLTAASYCVFLSNSYSYGDRVQAEDRIHRISATRNCTYIDLAYRETIDVRILEALEEKQDLAAIVKRDVRDLI